jgi:hypothetical protein
MLGWLDFLKPTNAGEWWTAIAAVATAVAVIYAVRATWYAASTVRIEQTPVLTLEHDHETDTVLLRNLGRGVAFVAFITEEDGTLVQVSPAIAPGDARRIDTGGMELSIFSGHFIYGEDIAGRWVRTFAVYRGLKRSDRAQFNNRIGGSIGKWQVPRKALRELRRSHRSALQHIHALGGYFNAEAWSHWVTTRTVQRRIAFFKWWHAIGEPRRVGRFSGRADKHEIRQVAVEERVKWPVDVDGLIDCWKGPRIARQLSCEWEDDVLVCEVLIQSGALPRDARGLLVIERAAYDTLPVDRSERNDWIRGRFDKYICGLRPQDCFVFVLGRIGPWLINRMF